MGQEVETSPQRRDRERMGVFTQWVEDLEKTLTNDPEALKRGKKIAQDLRGFLEGNQRALTELPKEIASDKLRIEKLTQQPELSSDDKSLLSGTERYVDSLQFNLECAKQFIEKYESQLQALLSRVDDAISRAEDMIKSKIETGDVKTIMANPELLFDIKTDADFPPIIKSALQALDSGDQAKILQKWNTLVNPSTGVLGYQDNELQELISKYQNGYTLSASAQNILHLDRLIKNYALVTEMLRKKLPGKEWPQLVPQQSVEIDGQTIAYKYKRQEINAV